MGAMGMLTVQGGLLAGAPGAPGTAKNNTACQSLAFLHVARPLASACSPPSVKPEKSPEVAFHAFFAFIQYFEEDIWAAKKCATEKVHGSVNMKFRNWGEFVFKVSEKKKAKHCMSFVLCHFVLPLTFLTACLSLCTYLRAQLHLEGLLSDPEISGSDSSLSK